MNTKPIPAIVMLMAGFTACLAGMNAHMEVADFLKMLLIVLIVFYILGCMIKAVMDKNFIEVSEADTTDGEEALGEDSELLENDTAATVDEE